MSKKVSYLQTLKLEKIKVLKLAAINCQGALLGLAESFFVATEAIERLRKKRPSTERDGSRFSDTIE